MTATFTRNSTSHLQNGTLVNTNLPRFETGRFGQAVMVEEGTTNLLLQSAAFTVTPWAHANVSFTSQPNYLDFITTRVTPMSASAASLAQTFSGTTVAGRTFTWSFWARGETTRSFGVNFWDGLNWQSRFISLTSTWQRFELTNTFLSGGTFGRIQWGNTSPHWGTTYMDWIDLAGVQLEERPYATTYMETGATIATRAAESLTIPTAGVLSPTEGTIEMVLPAGRRVAGNFGTGLDNQVLVDFAGTGLTAGYWHIDGAGRTSVWIGNGSATDGRLHSTVLDPARAYFVAIKWWAGHYALSVFDYTAGTGSTVTRAFGHAFVPVANMGVGSNFSRTGRWLSGTIDDLRISSRARTDQEIADAFASNQPLPVDASTTYLMRMDGTLSSSVTSFQQNTSVSTISSSVRTPMLIHTGLTSVTVAPSAPIHTRLIYVGLTSVQTVLRAQIILPPATPLKSIIAETQSVYRHTKQPLEERTLAIDFSSCGEIAAGETIQSVQVSTSIDSIGVGSRIVGNNVLIRISGGAHGENCILSIVATTNSGHRIESSVLIAVREELALTLAASTGGAPTVITPTITPLGQPFATFVVSDQYVYQYTKPPTEVRTLRIDYQWCGEIVAGETIQSARVTTLAGDVVVNYWIANNAVFVRMSGGTHGQSTIISVLAATNSRHLIEADVFVSVWGE